MLFSLHCVLYQEKLFNRDVHAWQGKQATVTMFNADAKTLQIFIVRK